MFEMRGMESVELREGGAYVITGGLGAACLRLAEDLTCSLHARLALVAGSAFPERGEWEGWLALRGADDPFAGPIRHLLRVEEAGGKLIVLRVNLTGESQLAAALDRATARLGRLDGVFHLADGTEEPAAGGCGLKALERILAGRGLGLHLLQPV